MIYDVLTSEFSIQSIALEQIDSFAKTGKPNSKWMLITAMTMNRWILLRIVMMIIAATRAAAVVTTMILLRIYVFKLNGMYVNLIDSFHSFFYHTQ